MSQNIQNQTTHEVHYQPPFPATETEVAISKGPKNADYRMIADMVLGSVVKTTKIEDLQEQLREAEIDPITLLHNRKAFNRDLEAIVHRKPDVGLIYVDLLGLKRTNDTLGHAEGDHYLRKSAQALQNVIRPTDQVYRIGGDELAVIMGDVPFDQRSDEGLPTKLADRYENEIHTALNTDPDLAYITEALGRPLHISAGVALFHEGETPEQLVARADEMLQPRHRANKAEISAAMVGPDLYQDDRLL